MKDVTVEPLQESDFEIAAAWLSDPDINRWLGSEWRGRRFDSRVLAIITLKPTNKMFMVRYRDDPCGLVTVGDIDRKDAFGTLWYLMGAKGLGGKGITSRAVEEVCRRSFADLSLRSIVASIVDSNIPSQRVLEKVGFKRVGTLRNGLSLDGEPVDRIVYDLLPEDLSPDH